MFWLGEDLFDEEMRETTEPDARALSVLRNHLEHKYVEVHEMGPPTARSGDPFSDTLAYAIGRTDLERKTVKLMQLALAALIYLFLGMHRHEATLGRDDAALSLQMPLDEWEDAWKM